MEDCTDIVATNASLKCENFGAYCIKFPPEYSSLTKSIKEALATLAKQYPLAKLVQSKVNTPADYVGKVGKLLTESVAEKLASKFNFTAGEIVFLAYGDKKEVVSTLLL